LILQEYRVDVKSLQSTRQHLRELLGIPVRKYDCCIRNCMTFTGGHVLRRRCLHCGQSRFDETTDDDEEFYPDLLFCKSLTPRATYSYIPIIPRLKLLYANRTYSKKMRYPKWGLTDEPWLDGLSGVRDVWEGKMMKQWKEAGTTRIRACFDVGLGYFDDERTVALQFSTDGVQLFRSSINEVWPFLVINLNLPPEERYHSPPSLLTKI
jgi:hypothetical protein